jgi:putative peptide zinc metalloprotease protein
MLDCPKLANSCSFHRYDNGGGSEEYVLASADGRQFKVSALAREVLSRLDGRTSIDRIAADLNAESVPITSDQLRTLIEERYAGLGVIEGASNGPSPEATRTVRRPGFPMLLTFDLLPQRLVAALAAPLRTLYAPAASVLLLGLIAWAHVLVYDASLDRVSLSPESYLMITGLCLLSIIFHELGHSAAVSRYGGTPGAIGCGLYLLLPTFFADVSTIWKLPRSQRMVVDLGGVYFQQIVFVLFAFGALATGAPELLATCRLIDLMVLTALNPLFHFDGYWFLADYLAMPKLQSLAFRSLAARFRQLAGRPAEPPRLPRLSRFAKGVFFSYSMLASLFLFMTFWLLYRHLSTTLLQFPIAAPRAFHAAAAAFASGNISLFLVRMMALFFLAAFPATALLGLTLYFARLARLLASRFARNRPAVGSTSQGD